MKPKVNLSQKQIYISQRFSESLFEQLLRYKKCPPIYKPPIHEPLQFFLTFLVSSDSTEYCYWSSVVYIFVFVHNLIEKKNEQHWFDLDFFMQLQILISIIFPTDLQKGFRIERQKGKAALGMLKPIEDLPIEACCVDNCVRVGIIFQILLFFICCCYYCFVVNASLFSDKRNWGWGIYCRLVGAQQPARNSNKGKQYCIWV